MQRTRWMGVWLLVAVLAGALGRWSWPSDRPALACRGDEIELGARGVAVCGEHRSGKGAGLSAAQRLALGLRLDLNAVSPAELALLPGVGSRLASRITSERARLGRFDSWDEVDEVRGVGPALLRVLQESAAIH